MRPTPGLTLLELLVALAVVAILTAIGWTVFRPPLSSRVAMELARLVRSARWAAVLDERPAILLARDGGRSIVVLRDGGWRCDAAAPGTLAWEAGGRRVVVAWPVRGVAFGPDGFPRSCHGDGVGAATVVVSDGAASAAVVVSSLGRVRWERRP
jgi:prepilin-type N-terminal cleavage/methylation domain-containing protein